ncbi:hypothetical protein HN709_01470 [Candidatus Peregrinibacteria bacterium]|nr:hypothetical protein [Candidatus Peregrinibacteria bacterium]MBT7736332.1 hypothetical protein [Candidatus Peregrinibacteria bacterium]
MGIALAEGEGESTANLGKALDDAIAAPCINLKDNFDNSSLITIIEEPLSLETDNEGDYRTRICYRNSFVYWSGEKNEVKKTLTELSKICSGTADDLVKDTGNATYNPQFTCRPVQVILSKGGTSMITGFINQIYKFAAGIVGIIAVAVIIISGIQISLGGGDTEAVSSAKDRIIKSLSGIAILFLSGLILYTVNPTFFTR